MRLRYHMYSGSIKEHYQQQHDENITLKTLIDNIKIIEKEDCSKRLNILQMY